MKGAFCGTGSVLPSTLTATHLGFSRGSTCSVFGYSIKLLYTIFYRGIQSFSISFCDGISICKYFYENFKFHIEGTLLKICLSFHIKILEHF